MIFHSVAPISSHLDSFVRVAPNPKFAARRYRLCRHLLQFAFIRPQPDVTNRLAEHFRILNRPAAACLQDFARRTTLEENLGLDSTGDVVTLRWSQEGDLIIVAG